MNFDEKDDYYAVNFEGLDCAEIEIEAKEFDNCTFTKCDFSEAHFKKCKFIECDFVNCNLSLAKVEYS
ncbi:MAG: pentapeptide repeat-containing protein, partial [Gammaproteobacteria bacterium]